MAIKKQTFMKSVAVVMGAQLLIKLMGFIYRVILTNIEGFQDAGNSYYGTGYKVYVFILAIATTGVPNAISKLVAEKMAVGDHKGAHKIFKTATQIFTLVGLFFAALLFFGSDFIAIHLLSNPGVAGTLATLAPSILFVSIASVFRGYFIGMQNVSAHSVAQVIEQIVNSVCSVVFVLMLMGKSPEIMAMGSTAATAVSTLVALVYLYMFYQKNKSSIHENIRNATPHIVESTKVTVRRIIKYVVPISFASIVVSLSGLVDVLSVMEGLQNYGYSLENVAIVTPLIPMITEFMVKKDYKGAQDRINFSMKLSSIIALPCTIGLVILAEPVFQAIFPNAPQGSLLLQIEAWAIIFSLLAQVAQGALNGIGKLIVPGLSVVVAAVVKYIFNVTLIPIYGEIIVPITTIVYHLVNCLIVTTVLYKALKSKRDIKNVIIKPLFAAIAMGIAVYFTYKGLCIIIASNVLNMGISIIVGALVYFILLLMQKTLTKEEQQSIPILNKVFSRF